MGDGGGDVELKGRDASESAVTNVRNAGLGCQQHQDSRLG